MASEHNYHVISPDYNIIRQPNRDAAIKYTQDNKSYEMLIDGKDRNGEYYGKWKAELKARNTTGDIATTIYMAGSFNQSAIERIYPMVKEATRRHRSWSMTHEDLSELKALLKRLKMQRKRPDYDEDPALKEKWLANQMVYNMNLSVILAPPTTVLIWNIHENVFTYQYIWELLSIRELRTQWFTAWSVICTLKGGVMGNGSDPAPFTKFGRQEISIPWDFEQFQVEYYHDTFEAKVSKSDLGPVQLIINPIGSRELLRDRENDYYTALKKADTDIKAMTTFSISLAAAARDEANTRAYAYAPERKQVPIDEDEDELDTTDDVDISDPTIPWAPEEDVIETQFPVASRRPERRLPLSRQPQQPRIVSRSSRGRGTGRGASLYGRPHTR